MPGIVDTSTGKIIGVKEGTLAYYHELGHIEYSKSNFGLRNQFYQESFLILSVGFLVLHLFLTGIYFKILPLTSFLLFFSLYTFEEIWCWRYAYKNKN